MHHLLSYYSYLSKLIIVYISIALASSVISRLLKKSSIKIYNCKQLKYWRKLIYSKYTNWALSCLAFHLSKKIITKKYCSKNSIWCLNALPTLSKFRCSESLALFGPCILVKFLLSYFCSAINAFVKHFETAQRCVKLEIYLIFVLYPRLGGGLTFRLFVSQFLFSFRPICFIISTKGC